MSDWVLKKEALNVRICVKMLVNNLLFQKVTLTNVSPDNRCVTADTQVI